MSNTIGRDLANCTVGFLRSSGGGYGVGAGGGAGVAGGGSGGNVPAPVGMGFNHIGNPVETVPEDSGEYFGIGKSFDTDAHRNKITGDVRNEGLSQREAARSPEQQLGNYAYYNWNLAKNNPRGNLNNRSYETTLRMQRLADAVNNRMHYDPGTAATIGGAQGAKSVGQGTATARKWEPMETQEMRQMRANERVDERARNAGVDLQSRIQAYPQEIQEEMDKKVMDLRDYIARMDDDYVSWFQKNVIEQEYNRSWQQYFAEKMNKYIIELNLDKSSRIYKELMCKMPSVQMAIAHVFGIPYTSSPLRQWGIENIVSRLVQSGQISMETLPILLDTINNAFAAMSYPQQVSMFQAGLGFGPVAGAVGSSGSSGASSRAMERRRASQEAHHVYN